MHYLRTRSSEFVVDWYGLWLSPLMSRHHLHRVACNNNRAHRASYSLAFGEEKLRYLCNASFMCMKYELHAGLCMLVHETVLFDSEQI